MWSNQANVFIGCDSGFDAADVVLFGAPFDGTTSFRPGARFAPDVIRGDSYAIEHYSPYQDKQLSDYPIYDSGDLEIPIGNAAETLDVIEAHAASIVKAGKKPVMIGGEHLVTLGAVRALAARYPDLHLIHLDAHTDLRDTFFGQKLSHATVMYRVWELLGDGRVYQFGIRSGEGGEFRFAQRHTVMHRYDLGNFAQGIQSLKGKPVYFSLDLDVLDPSVLPGTGTPEPGGVSFQALLEAVLLLGDLNVVGADVVELSPHYDPSGASTAAACKILRELLLTFYARRP